MIEIAGRVDRCGFHPGRTAGPSAPRSLVKDLIVQPFPASQAPNPLADIKFRSSTTAGSVVNACSEWVKSVVLDCREMRRERWCCPRPEGPEDLSRFARRSSHRTIHGRCAGKPDARKPRRPWRGEGPPARATLVFPDVGGPTGLHCFLLIPPCDRSIAGSVGIEVMSLWEEMSRILCERVARYAGHSGNRGGPHRLGAQFG